MLMAYPGAQLLQLTKERLAPVRIEETEHVRLMRELCRNPSTFVELMIEDELQS